MKLTLAGRIFFREPCAHIKVIWSNLARRPGVRWFRLFLGSATAHYNFPPSCNRRRPSLKARTGGYIQRRSSKMNRKDDGPGSAGVLGGIAEPADAEISPTNARSGLAAPEKPKLFDHSIFATLHEPGHSLT